MSCFIFWCIDDGILAEIKSDCWAKWWRPSPRSVSCYKNLEISSYSSNWIAAVENSVMIVFTYVISNFNLGVWIPWKIGTIIRTSASITLHRLRTSRRRTGSLLAGCILMFPTIPTVRENSRSLGKPMRRWRIPKNVGIFLVLGIIGIRSL